MAREVKVFLTTSQIYFRASAFHLHEKRIIRSSAAALLRTPNYKTPLELGIRLARRGSTSTAIRRARANALNAASTM